jgi:proteasome lid subunit RPN8/RPN11
MLVLHEAANECHPAGVFATNFSINTQHEYDCPPMCIVQRVLDLRLCAAFNVRASFPLLFWCAHTAAGMIKLIAWYHSRPSGHQF